MENLRKRNVASLIINLLIVVLTIESLIDGFRTDIIRDPDWFGFEGIHSLRFFTVLSNIFVAISSSMMIAFNIKNLVHDTNVYPKWLVTLKHMATSAVAVTFVTVALLLSPTYAIIGKGYFTLFLGNHVYMHLLTPILAIITFVFFECSHHIGLKNSLLAMVPVGLYAILYMTMVVFIGEANGGWPDFYNFTFGGNNWVIPFSIIGMLLVTFMISLLLAKWHNKNLSNGKEAE